MPLGSVMIEIILGKPGSEQHRSRLGFILLALGLLLMLWAWGSWIFRESVPAKAQVIVRTQSASGADSSKSDSDYGRTPLGLSRAGLLTQSHPRPEGALDVNESGRADSARARPRARAGGW